MFKKYQPSLNKYFFINNYRRIAKQATILGNSPNEYLLNQFQGAVANEAIAAIHLKEIQKVVYQLPDIFRNPFLLYFDGYKYHEIADKLHEPLGTIKSRIHFARKLLKSQIDRY